MARVSVQQRGECEMEERRASVWAHRGGLLGDEVCQVVDPAARRRPCEDGHRGARRGAHGRDSCKNTSEEMGQTLRGSSLSHELNLHSGLLPKYDTDWWCLKTPG